MNVHHNLWTWAWWANCPENKAKVNEYYHKILHMLVWVMPPHMVIRFMIKITWKCLDDKLKQEIEIMLTPENPETLYKEWVIKNIEKFKAACHKYLRIDYIK